MFWWSYFKCVIVQKRETRVNISTLYTNNAMILDHISSDYDYPLPLSIVLLFIVLFSPYFCSPSHAIIVFAFIVIVVEIIFNARVFSVILIIIALMTSNFEIQLIFPEFVHLVKVHGL